jgi:hypothetical protein
MRVRATFFVLCLLSGSACAAPIESQDAAVTIAKGLCGHASKRYEYRFFDQWVAITRDNVWLVTGTHNPRNFGPMEFDETLGVQIPKNGSAPSSCTVIGPHWPSQL